MTPDPALPTLTVYYNTRCPVCDGGIDWQKNRMVQAVREGRIVFRDINMEPEALEEYGSSLEYVRKKLHAVDANGSLYVGAEAFAEIGLRTEGQEWLARLIRLPLIRPLAGVCYDGIAELLYRWNRHKGRW